MIIQHNISALNSHRQLGINNTNLSNNLEKLSSGYRINRAADDAAGLAISEKMRAQITGLDRAILNAQDGASLIQTAEGALAQVHEMLNRMVELGTQSANGTLGADDRMKIESEVTALKDEIDRISKSTNFNGIQLLDGSLANSASSQITVEGVKVSETAAVAGNYVFDGPAADGANLTVTGGQVISVNVALNNGDSVKVSFKVSDDAKTLTSVETGTQFTLTSGQYQLSGKDMMNAVETELRKTSLQNDFIIDAGVNTTSTTSGIVLTSRVAGESAPQVTGISWTVDSEHYSALSLLTPTSTDVFQVEGTTVIVKEAADEVRTIKASAFIPFTVHSTNVTNEEQAIFTVNGEKFVLVSANTATSYRDALVELQNRGVNIITVTDPTNISSDDLLKIASTINQKTGLDFKLNAAGDGIIIDSKGIGNGLTMQIGDTGDDWNKITVSVEDMSSSGLGISNIDMKTQESANSAINRIKAAIERVSVARGDLGALQNRLDYTIANLGVTKENMTAAESRIRDVDMASEMMYYTKNNVLSQAAQAMLAQANQQPQQVLQLLR